MENEWDMLDKTIEPVCELRASEPERASKELLEAFGVLFDYMTGRSIASFDAEIPLTLEGAVAAITVNLKIKMPE